MPVAQSSGILAVIYLCPWVVSSNFVFFLNQELVVPMWNMYFQNAPWKACLTRERSCVVFTHWEQFFIPFWNLGVPTTQSCDSRNILKGHNWFVRMTHNLSLLCFCSGWRRRHQNKTPKQLWGVKRLKIFAFSMCFGRLAEVLTIVFRKIL